MRDLDKAYNKSLKDIDILLSEKNMQEVARKKLLGVDFEDVRHLKYDLNTQRGVCLDCICILTKRSYSYDLSIPFIDASVTFRSSYKISFDTGRLIGSYVGYSELCSIINNHKNYCKKNYVQKYGNLLLGFYSLGGTRYFAGMVGDRLVFIFNTGRLCIMNNMFLYNDYIEVILNNNIFVLDLEDYSLRKDDKL